LILVDPHSIVTPHYTLSMRYLVNVLV